MKSLLCAVLPFLLCAVFFAQETRFQFTHKGSVFHVKFSPSGSKLISYSSGNQDLASWEVSTGHLLWKRPISFIQKADEYYTLNAIAWSPDERLVATGSANGTVQLWSASDGAFQWRADASKDGISAIAFSPDGKTLAATGYGVSGAAATLVDVANGRPLKNLVGNKCPAIAVAFAPSGKELSIGNLNGNVALWDLTTEKPVIPADCKGRFAYAGERSFSQDLSLSVRRTTADQIALEDSDGKVIKTFDLNDSRMRSVVNSRAQKAVIEKYGGYRLYDLSSGAERMLSDCVSGSAFDLSDDGNLFAQSCDGFKTSIRVTDLNSGKPWSLDGHPSMIQAIAYSPDFSLLAIGGNDGNAYLFNPETKTLNKTLAGTGVRLTAVAFSSDGKRLITGDENSVVHLWDLSKATSLSDVKVTDERSDDIDKIEASIDGKNVLILINSQAFLLDSELRVRGPLQTPDGYSSTSGNMTSTYLSVPISDAAFSASGTQVITAHPDGTLRFSDASTLHQEKKLKIADSVKFVSPVDETRVLVIVTVGERARFRLIDLISGKTIKQSDGIEPSYLEKMFVSRDKRLAAVTDISGDMVICDLTTMTLRTLENGLSGDDSVAFGVDAKEFFIGGKNQNLSLYDTVSLKKLWTLLPEFTPSPAETRLTQEKAIRVAAVDKAKKRRDREASAYIKANRQKIYVTFEHYGDMSDPGEMRMIERNELNESKPKKSFTESNAVWLRLHNDSTLPIEVPTESMYMPDPKCFHQFSNEEKLSGLCNGREIGLRFGVRDRRNAWVPYGFDFGSSLILLPHTSVLFPVPLGIWNKPYSVVFDYSFQNIRASENDREMDFGPKVEIRVSKATLRRP